MESKLRGFAGGSVKGGGLSEDVGMNATEYGDSEFASCQQAAEKSTICNLIGQKFDTI